MRVSTGTFELEQGWPVDWVLPWGSAAGIFVRTGLHVCHGCADVLLAGYQHIT